MAVLLLILFLAEQFDEVDAGGFGFGRCGRFGRRQLGVDDGIDEARHALRFSLEIDLHLGGVERIETHFDGFAGQMRRGFVEAVLQQESAIAAHQAIQAMEEETAEIGGRRELADVLDIALPAQQRSGSQSAVLGAVIGVSIQAHRRSFSSSSESVCLRSRLVRNCSRHGAEEALDFSAALGLIGRSVHDEHADGGGDARQLRAAIDLGVVHVEPHRHAAGGDGLAQTIQAGIQSLAGIELGVRDEAAGIIQDGMQEGLHLAAAGALDVGAEEHVRLPDLVAVFGFELLVRRRSEQLAFRKAALFEEAVEGGGGDAGACSGRTTEPVRATGWCRCDADFRV